MAGQKQAKSGGQTTRRAAGRSQHNGQQTSSQQTGGQQRNGQQRSGRQQPGEQRSGQQRSGQQRSAQGRGASRSGAAVSGPAAAGGRAAASSKAGQARQGESAAALPQQSGAPGWLRWTTLALALAGLGLSIYLTVAHLVGTQVLACSDKGLVNCAAVTTSTQSKLFGVFPVAELGLAFYVFMVAATTPWAWRMRWPAVYWLRLGSVIVGMLFVLYLVYVELIQLHHICLFCTYTHIVTFLLFVLLVFYAASRQPPGVTASQAGRAEIGKTG